MRSSWEVKRGREKLLSVAAVTGSAPEGADNPTVALARLKVTAEADPGALSRVLGPLQNLNLTPRRVIAESSSSGRLHIEVDIVGLSGAQLSSLSAQVGRDARVFNAYWHRV